MSAAAIRLLGPVRYAAGVDLQDALVRARQQDLIPDTVLFLEHAPVVTLGRRGRSGYVLATPEALAKHGIDYVVSSRGGDVTFHGPGQLVIYPILKLGSSEADSHGYLWNLEEIAIRTAADFGVAAFRRGGMSGAWTTAGKIAAIGFHLRRWVTEHGMSLNVKSGLDGFSMIVGCGLVGERVASLEDLLGASGPTIDDAVRVVARHASAVLGRPFDRLAAKEPALHEILRASGLAWRDAGTAG